MNKVIKALAVCFIVLLARSLPLSVIVGKWHVMFSWISLVSPAISNHFGFSWLAALVICNKIWLAPSLLLLWRRIPIASLCAARVFAQREIALSIILPILCMILFVMHPTGKQAWVYALYWVIPPLLWVMKDTVWIRALQASFVCHAIGSVVWLYTGDLSAGEWISLMPIVIVERAIIALGMILCDQVLGFCVDLPLLSWVSKKYYRLVNVV